MRIGGPGEIGGIGGSGNVPPKPAEQKNIQAENKAIDFTFPDLDENINISGQKEVAWLFGSSKNEESQQTDKDAAPKKKGFGQILQDHNKMLEDLEKQAWES